MTTKAEALEAQPIVQAAAERIVGYRLGSGLSRAGDGGWAVVLIMPEPVSSSTERRIKSEFPRWTIKFRADPQGVLHGG